MYGAISHSCNSYFFDVGRMLTIRKMSTYAELFALGEATGCELPESVGIMSDPVEYTERHNGAAWYDGLTIQAAIGQCDNMFTPIELATYCSMIANGGTRYRTHFLEKVTDYDRVITRETAEPEVVLQAEIAQENFEIVREGMRQVCTEGTAATTFADFGVAVAGKTGTAEKRRPFGQHDVHRLCALRRPGDRRRGRHRIRRLGRRGRGGCARDF